MILLLPFYVASQPIRRRVTENNRQANDNTNVTDEENLTGVATCSERFAGI